RAPHSAIKLILATSPDTNQEPVCPKGKADEAAKVIGHRGEALHSGIGPTPLALRHWRSRQLRATGQSAGDVMLKLACSTPPSNQLQFSGEGRGFLRSCRLHEMM